MSRDIGVIKGIASAKRGETAKHASLKTLAMDGRVPTG